jgi:hypothetical protein
LYHIEIYHIVLYLLINKICLNYENAVEMVNIHILYLLMIGERCTRYDRQLQVIVRAFVCAIFIKFFSLLYIRRKCINKNLECPLVYTDI